MGIEQQISSLNSHSDELSDGQIATLACLLEVSAAKPGNVHRGADFEDLTLNDFLVSAVMLGQAIDNAGSNGVGSTVLKAVRSTRNAVKTNTNLGIALLIVPLSKNENWIGRSLEHRQAQMLSFVQALGSDDGGDIFEAIRLAQPGGMGRVVEHDVNDIGSQDLAAAMKAASNRDTIARQYCNGFENVFNETVSFLVRGMNHFGNLSQAIVFAHVNLMAVFPDSLIERKCGKEIALLSSAKAQETVDALQVSNEEYWKRVANLDFWLRCDGHRRNPGTTADLIAAGLFVAIKEKAIQPPY